MDMGVHSEFDPKGPQTRASYVRISTTVYIGLKEIAVNDYRLSSGRNMDPSADTIAVKALLLGE